MVLQLIFHTYICNMNSNLPYEYLYFSFLACILLMNRSELVQLVTDVYSDGPPYLISYDTFKMLLHNVLDTKTGGNCEL